MHCEARHLRNCALAPILRDLRGNAAPNREAEHNVAPLGEFGVTLTGVKTWNK